MLLAVGVTICITGIIHIHWLALKLILKPRIFNVVIPHYLATISSLTCLVLFLRHRHLLSNYYVLDAMPRTGDSEKCLSGHSFLTSYLPGSPSSGKCHLTSTAAYSPSRLHILSPFSLLFLLQFIPFHPQWSPYGCSNRSRCSPWHLKAILCQPDFLPQSNKTPCF